jgi:hypothetical protein
MKKSLALTISAIESGSTHMGLEFNETEGPLDPNTTRQDVVDFLSAQFDSYCSPDTAKLACAYALKVFSAIEQWEQE